MTLRSILNGMTRILGGLALSGTLTAVAAGSLAAVEWPDQLVVYAIPAPRPIKWGSPRKLALRSLGNRIAFQHKDQKHTIGHVFVRVISSEMGRHELTGMSTRAATEDVDLILKDDYGLGVLGADMMGRLEVPEDLEPEILARAATGLMATMRFLIKPEAATRMIQFLDEYRAKGLDDHYGGANRPRYGEGGGCSAFTMAFLELGGLVQPEFQSWRVDFRVPKAMYGGPLTGLRAPLARTLMQGGRWAREDEPHVASMFWDPSRMFSWIKRTVKSEEKNPTGQWDIEAQDRMKGLVHDSRAVPVPQEPIWLEDAPGEGNPYGRQESVRRDTYPEDGEREEDFVPAIRAILAHFGEAPFEAVE